MAKKSKLTKEEQFPINWNGYEFRLYVPKSITKDNKIEVHFNYINPATNKPKQIKKSTGIDRNAIEDVYVGQAITLTRTLIEMLQAEWNPITNSYPEHTKLNSFSDMNKCIDSWLEVRQADFDAGKIQKGELNLTKNVFDLYRAYLIKNNLLSEKPGFFTVNDINQFMRYIEKDSNRLRKDSLKPDRVTPLGKPTYNSYLSRLTFFFDFLIIERLLTHNPTTGAHRYKTKNLATRFKIYELDELQSVREILGNDSNYLDLLIASHLLYSYRIRAKEQLRIKVGYIDFEQQILTIPEEVEERGRIIKGTKNGNSAQFQLGDKVIKLIKDYLGEDIRNTNYFLFGGANKAGVNQKYESYFANKWAKFRIEYGLPLHLKFYSLKHTSNYNSLETIGIEALSKINRHATISQTQDYVKSKLKKEVITIRSDNEF